MKKIDPRFATHSLDLAAMQRSAEAVCNDVVKIAEEGVTAGKLDVDLLRSALLVLMATSARAQEEYFEVRGQDESLPSTWTKVAFSN